jgi:hypothetical protein
MRNHAAERLADELAGMAKRLSRIYLAIRS